jgi:hypothetical protein
MADEAKDNNVDQTEPSVQYDDVQAHDDESHPVIENENLGDEGAHQSGENGDAGSSSVAGDGANTSTVNASNVVLPDGANSLQDICRKFLLNRCNATEKCRYVHVPPEDIEYYKTAIMGPKKTPEEYANSRSSKNGRRRDRGRRSSRDPPRYSGSSGSRPSRDGPHSSSGAYDDRRANAPSSRSYPYRDEGLRGRDDRDRRDYRPDDRYQGGRDAAPGPADGPGSGYKRPRESESHGDYRRDDRDYYRSYDDRYRDERGRDDRGGRGGPDRDRGGSDRYYQDDYRSRPYYDPSRPTAAPQYEESYRDDAPPRR